VTVVSNAGPLIALARIAETDLLPRLYGAIVIPPAVRAEITKSGRERPGSVTFKSAEWLRVRKISDLSAVEPLRGNLDAGESEAIVLALELEADVLLMDEALGRRAASEQGVTLSGTLGTLLLAKEENVIDEVAPVVDQLISTGFRVSDSLYQHVLKQAGEA
jgi:predicted nucleic acid-binding protein